MHYQLLQILKFYCFLFYTVHAMTDVAPRRERQQVALVLYILTVSVLDDVG
jgi:hypothetical protein